MAATSKTGIKLPPSFDDEDDFLDHIRKTLHDDLEYDRNNREAAKEDARFLVGDQWDDNVRSVRDSENKPSLTVNRLPAFLGQIIGNRRLNETSIKVVADRNGTKDIAEIRQGLIRSIEKDSKADRAYNNALECCATGGIGNFELLLEFADDDVFEQVMRIAKIKDPFAVVWDKNSTDPTGYDARRCFVLETLSKQDFEELYPDVDPGGLSFSTEHEAFIKSDWEDGDEVVIAKYWRMGSRKRTLALMADDGDTEDITDEIVEDEDGDPAVPEELSIRIKTDDNGEPIVREVDMPFAEMYVVSGRSVLEGPYRLPIKRVPVFRVPGWEVHADGETHRWGLIRFMKDPMRFHNYWSSVIAEKLLMAPKVRYIASDIALQGYEDDWREAHLSDDPVLMYNGESGQAPIPVPPATLETALIQASERSVQDLRDVSNMHEASFGQVSNEVSGKAILARQRVGELGTVIYTDNLNMAIEECGAVINDLIPIVYDTARTVKTIGEDDATRLIDINDPDNGGPDITVGKYKTSIITGPSYATKRIEASESMLAFMNTMPQAAQVVADLIAEAQDWPGAGKISRRLRSQIPPDILGEEDLTDEQKQAQQAAAQEAQRQQQIAERREAAETQKIIADARKATADARESIARAIKAETDAEVSAEKLDAEIDKLDAETEKAHAQALAARRPQPRKETSNER